MISSYILPILCTATSVCHALYLQSSSVPSSSSLAYYSSLQKKHHLRYATHHHPSPTSNTLLAFSSTIHTRPHRISNRRCITILNNALNINNEQQIDESEEHLVGIGVGIDLGTTNSAIAMMIPYTDIDDSESDEGASRYVHRYRRSFSDVTCKTI